MRSKSLVELDRLTLPQPNQVPICGGVDRWFGVEHEYSVVGVDHSGMYQHVDFRHVISRLGLDHGHLDPGDPLAHFLTFGGVVTADGHEAEIATPPVRLGPSFSHQAVRHTAHAYDELQQLVSPQWSLRGYSTHISVQVPDRDVVVVGKRFVHSAAPAMMLLLDHQDSPGLLVRPRRGRLELCGDFVRGDQLRAASVFGASATIALQHSKAPKNLRLHGQVVPARERFGYYIDRCAFGPDLYQTGRITPLPARRSRTAQQHVEQIWEWVRPTAQRNASDDEVQLVDDVVSGNSPIPLEARLDSHTAVYEAPESDAFGRALVSRTIGHLCLGVKQMRWDCVIFELSDPKVEESVFIAVPGIRLEGFLHAADRGAVQQVMSDIFAKRHTFPVLASVDQTSEIGAFARIGQGANLVPGERNPVTGKIDGPNGPGSREQKEQSRSQEWPKPQHPTIHPGIIAAIIVAVLFTGLIGALFLFGGDEEATIVDDGFDEDFGIEFEDPAMFEEFEHGRHRSSIQTRQKHCPR